MASYLSIKLAANHMVGRRDSPAVRVVFFAVTAMLVFVLFGHSFTTYFFQDDWFSLLISQVNSPQDIVGFFRVDPALIYYRPIGMQLIFGLFQSLFGLSPLPFRVLTFFLHMFNGYLVFALLTHVTKRQTTGYIASFLYLVSAVHFTPFYWAATIAFVLGPTLYLATFFAYLHRRYRYALILFIIGLLSNELLISLPIMLLLRELLLVGKKRFGRLMPFFATAGVYGLFRLTVARPIAGGSYALTRSPQQLLFNLREYVLWIFNWPEEVHNQFVRFFVLNPIFVQEFRFFILPMILLTVGAGIIFGVLPAAYSIKNKQLPRNGAHIVYGFVWFLITLSPVLFFSQHVFSYYLPIPLVGALISGAFLYEQIDQVLLQNRFVNRVVIGTFLLLWFAAAFANTRFNQLIHWAPRRAAIAQDLVTTLQRQHPNPADGAILSVPDTPENFWALSDQNALRVIYDDETIITRYE